MALVVVIQFPGVNCEYETVRALEYVGLEGTIIRWNEPLSILRRASAVVLPGGFSYQDRIRAGVVAAKDRVVDEIFRISEGGIPILGICNGAQILVEAGIVPGFSPGRVSVALSPNKMPDRFGYHCRWVRIKTGLASCIFTEDLKGWEEEDGTIPCPVAHAEGRFVTEDGSTRTRLEKGEGVALYYASKEDRVADRFPFNPNGSYLSIAGLTNPSGNVLALMPHPERATWLYQVPFDVNGYWGRARLERAGDVFSPGPGSLIFRSLAKALL